MPLRLQGRLVLASPMPAAWLWAAPALLACCSAACLECEVPCGTPCSGWLAACCSAGYLPASWPHHGQSAPLACWLKSPESWLQHTDAAPHLRAGLGFLRRRITATGTMGMRKSTKRPKSRTSRSVRGTPTCAVYSPSVLSLRYRLKPSLLQCVCAALPKAHPAAQSSPLPSSFPPVLYFIYLHARKQARAYTGMHTARTNAHVHIKMHVRTCVHGRAHQSLIST